ncbi:type II toxin-antitoxin system RelE/ParE family toxin [Sphingomonas sp. IBVSS2]|uniref:type II toxin-antitoxin system RelE/ParE family toxin n=2 Tax=Pseudomonadota TaxID=1224 RepID=UPI00277D07D5|nr:type II toxin-antitoxin system RelE/ParE family toxin [Sphingomonas sp. IBVSS2]
MAGLSGYRLFPQAELRLAEIVDYTRSNWGDAQAIAYLDGMLAHIETIAERASPWRTIPAELGVAGYYCRFERHLLYWRVLEDGDIGIVTILHERMQQVNPLREAFASPD